MSKRSFFAELKRRNVYRAAVIYAASAWVLVQVLDLVSPYFQIPEWAVRWAIVAAAIGFPLWLAFSWFYEFTPDGLKRESEVERQESITHVTGRKLDFAIIGVLALAVVLLLTDRFVLRRGVNQQPAVAVSEKSIAVLPFVNMSSDKEQEYFSDGISEELLNLLAKIPALHVAARTSSFSFKGKDAPIPEIAKTLHVAHVLEGSVRKSGDQVRITTQLIRASDGYHLWSETYDRKLDDIFAIQDEIAATVVQQLKVTLLGEAPKTRTTDPEAYALYLRARQLAAQFTPAALEESNSLLRKVLEIDPGYALAWVRLGQNAFNQANLGVMSFEQASVRRRATAAEAEAIDPDLPELAGVLSQIADFDNDSAGAARHLQRGLAAEPGNLVLLGEASVLLQNLGRAGEAVTLSEAIVRRDPLNINALFNLGNQYRIAGRFEEAIATFRTVLSLSPDNEQTRSFLGITLLLKGDAAGGLAEIEREPNEMWRALALPLAYHALGRGQDADKSLEVVIARLARDASFNIAGIHAFRGDADMAFEWLEKAVEYQDPGLSEILADPLVAKVHADPRWIPFLRKLGRAPEQLAKVDFKVSLPAEWQAEAAASAATADPTPAEAEP